MYKNKDRAEVIITVSKYTEQSSKVWSLLTLGANAFALFGLSLAILSTLPQRKGTVQEDVALCANNSNNFYSKNGVMCNWSKDGSFTVGIIESNSSKKFIIAKKDGSFEVLSLSGNLSAEFMRARKAMNLWRVSHGYVIDEQAIENMTSKSALERAKLEGLDSDGALSQTVKIATRSVRFS